MLETKSLKALCNPTRLMVLGLLAEQPLTNTELFQKLGLKNRESIFKALKKLLTAGLVKRQLGKKGYE